MKKPTVSTIDVTPAMIAAGKRILASNGFDVPDQVVALAYSAMVVAERKSKDRSD